MPSGQVSNIPWKVLNKRSNWFIQLMDIFFAKGKHPQTEIDFGMKYAFLFPQNFLTKSRPEICITPKTVCEYHRAIEISDFSPYVTLHYDGTLSVIPALPSFLLYTPPQRPWLPWHPNNPMSAGKCTPPATFVIDIRATWLCHTVRTMHGRCPISLRMFAFRLRSLDF